MGSGAVSGDVDIDGRHALGKALVPEAVRPIPPVQGVDVLIGHRGRVPALQAEPSLRACRAAASHKPLGEATGAAQGRPATRPAAGFASPGTMDSSGPEVPPVLPGQGPYMRDVLHRCIIEASGEIDGVGEISERALNTIADIVLDCEVMRVPFRHTQRCDSQRQEWGNCVGRRRRMPCLLCQPCRRRQPAVAHPCLAQVLWDRVSQTFNPWGRPLAALQSCSAGRASTWAICCSE